MQAGTRYALSCMDRYQPTGPHGHVSGLKLTWDTVSAGGYDLFDPIGYLDRKRDRAYKQRVIVTNDLPVVLCPPPPHPLLQNSKILLCNSAPTPPPPSSPHLLAR